MKILVCLLAITSLLNFAAAKTQPNIILILADDLGYGSLGCYGHQQIKTPNIDELAAQGMKFTDFHSNGALCTPTRAALMTGRYQQRCQWVPDAELSPLFRKQRQENPVQRWAWGISTQEITIPHLLQKAGYQTAVIGKWHLGYDQKFHPMNYGFSHFRGFIGGGVDYHTHIATHGTQQLDWWSNQTIKNEDGYTTDLLTKHAQEFIIKQKKHPFFLYLAHATPHSPWQSAQINSKKSPLLCYQDMITSLDHSVGEIIKTLREHQLEQTTCVFFCSDNGPQAPKGFAANGPFQGKKGSLLEAGHRVPCIASWPGKIRPGVSSPTPSMIMDFLPTFVHLASAAIPQGHTIDGINLLPHLLGESTPPDRELHWQHGNAWALRQGSWKAVGKNSVASMLFDLSSDPAEKTNLIKQKPELAAELVKKHIAWVKQVGSQ